ncbi:unnamed protein product [Trichogramma brassicae]|uniref:Cytochrome c oxidase subunit 5A, mitochondrial n=1 Tax=Trichogramma brassicae TaxID=86971 RepID=A0A6H5IAQ2_9HYME|nr:unnamed protein product [Trichogramma brassicae]
MLRIAAGRLTSSLRQAVQPRQATGAVALVQARASHGHHETDEEPDIDHWEIRKAMNDLAGMDLVPEPKIICAALKACRRLNDYALTTRFLESVKDKCGPEVDKIYPYILQEIRPTLDELGISTPEELGYDQPELWLESPENIH